MNFSKTVFILALAVSSCTGPALAPANEACAGPEAQLAVAHTVDPGVQMRVLTPAEAARALAIGVSGGPDEAKIDKGAVYALTSGAVILFVWEKDGTCGHVLVPTPVIPAMLRAIEGPGA